MPRQTEAQAALSAVDRQIAKVSLVPVAVLALLIFSPKTMATIEIYDCAILAVFVAFVAFSIRVTWLRRGRLLRAVRAEKTETGASAEVSAVRTRYIHFTTPKGHLR